MTKYVVTDKGPIDWHNPGEDVTGIYPVSTLERLIANGFVKEERPPKSKSKSKGKGKGKTQASAEIDQGDTGGKV